MSKTTSEGDLPTIFAAFEERVVAVVEARVLARIMEVFARGVLDTHAADAAKSVKRGLPRASSRAVVTTRDPLNKAAPGMIKALVARKPQLCPVPRCKGVAAPVYNMVCKRHKDVPKAKIAKFREARRLANAKAAKKAKK
jgi:hypothetical protein